jgi:hypothetical protein
LAIWIAQKIDQFAMFADRKVVSGHDGEPAKTRPNEKALADKQPQKK